MALEEILRAQKRLREQVQRGRTPRSTREPKRARQRYRSALLGLMDEMAGEMREGLHPAIEGIAAQPEGEGERQDAALPPDVERRLEELRERLMALAQGPRVERIIDRIGEDVASFSLSDMSSVLSISLPEMGLGPQLEAFAEQNAQLITSIAEDHLGEAAKVVETATTRGMRVESIAQLLEERFDVIRSRAQVIARTETAKLKAQIDRRRAQNVGVTHFFWVDSSDERVRPKHERLDGQRFAYDNPPRVGLPGEPINCRCTATPDTSTVLGG
jgi:SPP1 gp7 family putative phage head morphogenesis protein